MRFLLPLLFWTGAAHAATITVPNDEPTIASAVAAAVAGDTISVLPGLHVIDSQIVINKDLTITAPNPPREIDDTDDVDDDTVVYLDVPTVSLFPGFDGAFLIRPNRTLTFENIRFKQMESICGDKIDNDGNGYLDEDDPACAFDTDTSDVTFVGTYISDVRAFNVGRDATLRIVNTELQGWSWAVEGNVIRADNANEVLIENSRFISNIGLLGVTPNGDFTRSKGIIYARGARVTVQDSEFNTNRQLYGGGIYAIDGSFVILDDNSFTACGAEDGGAVYVESSTLVATKNFFVDNSANVVPNGRRFVTYEGGAIYAEDSDVDIQNNVFLANGSLDWAASMMLRRNADDNVPPRIVNNTFVENSPNLLGGASVMFDDTRFEYINNISYGEGDGVIGAQNWEIGTVPTVLYNDFFAVGEDDILVAELSALPVEPSTNIFEDPMFVYYEQGDHTDHRLWRFWLDPLSPAVDAGDPSIFDVGDPDNRSDMGAYGGANSGLVDNDGDGWLNIYDCDDTNPDIKPFALELCDDLDNDCNGIVDDREETLYHDKDFDGYGCVDNANQTCTQQPVTVCPEDAPPPISEGVYVRVGGDCNDSNILVSPGRVEFCDQIDNDCDGDVDEQIVARPHYLDNDLDGFGTRDSRTVIVVDCPPEGFSPFNTDCNDNDATIHPLITINSQTHEPLATKPLEENEADRDISYVADGIDQDCDRVDLCYTDFDRDGYGAAPTDVGLDPQYTEDNDLNCRNLSSFTAVNANDCDDGDPKSFPGGIEVPGDGLDQNCDGADLCYRDQDDDGYGSAIEVIDNDLDCSNASAPTSAITGDCDDENADVLPTAEEVCDGLDNDCNGEIDENAQNSPDANEFFLDADGDGYGETATRIKACGNPIGYSLIGTDCDDADPNAFPGNQETCDGVDNNCQGGVDEPEAAIDVRRFFEDQDGDGYGNPNVSQVACDTPDGPWVPAGSAFDCDDTEASVGPCFSCDGCSNGGQEGTIPFLLTLLGFGVVRRRRKA